MMIETITRQGCHMTDLPSHLLSQRRAIFLTGEINDQTATQIIQQLMYLSDISHEDIELYINSPGGSVTAGLAVYDVMKSCGCDVSTVCTGIAASMGAFLLAAGTPGKRCCTPHSEIMIHQVSGGSYGQATDIEIAAGRIRGMKARLNRMLAEMTGQSQERIRLDTERDYFLSAQEALEYGIIDRIR